MSSIKVDDLAALMGKTRAEVEAMLKNDDVIELKLTERKRKTKTTDSESGKIMVV